MRVITENKCLQKPTILTPFQQMTPNLKKKERIVVHASLSCLPPLTIDPNCNPCRDPTWTLHILYTYSCSFYTNNMKVFTQLPAQTSANISRQHSFSLTLVYLPSPGGLLMGTNGGTERPYFIWYKQIKIFHNFRNWFGGSGAWLATLVPLIPGL